MSALPSLAGFFWNRAYLLLSFASLTWAVNIVIGRAVADAIPPIMLNQIRWTGATVILMPFAWRWIRSDWRTIRAHLPILLILSLTGITLYNSMAYYGLHYTQAINGLLMQSTAPLLIGLWSLVLFRDRLSLAQLGGILLSLFGVVLIIARGDLGVLATLRLNPGDIWMVAAMMVYSLYSALLRARPAIHPLAFLGFTLFAGQAMTLPGTITEAALGHHISFTPAAILAMAYVALFPSLIAYLCFNRGVELVGPNRAGPYFHLMPVFGSAIAVLFLGEEPQLFHALGYALIIAGIVAAQKGGRRETGRERTD